MATITGLLRTKISVVWLVLIAATCLSWLLGSSTGHGSVSSGDHEVASVVVLLVAFFKLRLVGMYFMELRYSPRILRSLFDGYCVIVCTTVVRMFLVTG